MFPGKQEMEAIPLGRLRVLLGLLKSSPDCPYFYPKYKYYALPYEPNLLKLKMLQSQFADTIFIMAGLQLTSNNKFSIRAEADLIPLYSVH
jgi:hypothetical protein